QGRNPGLIWFAPESSGVTLSEADWQGITGTIGLAGGYLWTVGECSNGTFTPRALPWRRFTVVCNAVLSHPGQNANNITFPQDFPWTVPGDCYSQCLAFATSSNPAHPYMTQSSSPTTLTQAEWNSIATQLNSPPTGTFYWNVGECDGDIFIPHGTFGW